VAGIPSLLIPSHVRFPIWKCPLVLPVLRDGGDDRVFHAGACCGGVFTGLEDVADIHDVHRGALLVEASFDLVFESFLGLFRGQFPRFGERRQGQTPEG